MPVTFRATSTDAIHGFVVGTTNANTMLIPGFVATFTTTFRQARRAADALPRVLRHRPRGDVGARAGDARRRVPREGARRREVELCSSLSSSCSRTSGSPSSPSSARSCSANGRCSCAVRSSQWVNNPEHYYRSVTAHGTVMAYVLPTLVAMGFGYAITELALKQPLIGVRWAWAGFWLVIAGTAMAAVTMAPRQGLGALHLLPADDRQPLLLPRRRARRRRLVDMGRADVHQPAGLEEGEPRRGRCRWRCSATSPARTCGPGRRSAPRSRFWC